MNKKPLLLTLALSVICILSASNFFKEQRTDTTQTGSATVEFRINLTHLDSITSAHSRSNPLTLATSHYTINCDICTNQQDTVIIIANTITDLTIQLTDSAGNTNSNLVIEDFYNDSTQTVNFAPYVSGTTNNLNISISRSTNEQFTILGYYICPQGKTCTQNDRIWIQIDPKLTLNI